MDSHHKIRSLLSELANQDAMPVLNWRAATELLFKGKKRNAKAIVRKIASRRGPKEEKKYRFVVPVTTWASDRIHPALSLICPRSEVQLDPRTDPAIIRLLTDGDTSGFIEYLITFDENDAFDRVASEGNKYFGAVADPVREFSESFLARSYLDLIRLAIDEDKCDESVEHKLINALLLPDIHGQATPLPDLYFSAPLPSDIPGLHLPPVLHEDLVAHPLFRRRKWRRPKYTMANPRLEAPAKTMIKTMVRKQTLEKQAPGILPSNRTRSVTRPNPVLFHPDQDERRDAPGTGTAHLDQAKTIVIPRQPRNLRRSISRLSSSNTMRAIARCACAKSPRECWRPKAAISNGRKCVGAWSKRITWI